MTLADQVEAAFLEQPQADCPVTHRFGPGIYIREVLLPRGAYVVVTPTRRCTSTSC